MASPECIIIDDDELSISLITEILDDIGEFTYKAFSTPSKVVDFLVEHSPKIIICNVAMKGNDVRVLCENKMSNHKLDVPFIFISIFSKHEERRECYIKSPHPYVTSPLSTESIKAHLQKIF